MRFAISFILFFVIDILIFHRFYIFGMAPVENLAAAVGLFTGIIYLLNKKYYPHHQRGGGIYWGFFFISLYPFLNAIPMYLLMTGKAGPIEFGWQMTELIGQFNLWIVGGLFLYCLFLYRRIRDIIFRWLVFSMGALTVQGILNALLQPIPAYYYRYSGFLNVPVLFAWLMILYHILQMKYGHIEEITEEMAPSYRREIKGLS